MATVLAAALATAGTTTFVVDGNRMYAELGFVRPDGSIHRALAFVDMGSPSISIRQSLFDELELDKRALAFRLGDLEIAVPRGDVTREARAPGNVGSDLKVEALLPAGVLQRYQVAIDYRQHTLTLAAPGSLKPDGVGVPFRIKPETGLIAADATIDGTTYPITIDNGSAYTWVRDRVARKWIAAHPEWVRGTGAVGVANMMMSGDRTETAGTLLRVPRISLGSLSLDRVGVLAAGPGRSPVPGLEFFDWYAQKNAVPVVGWIGANVLKAFRITVDYQSRTMYWSKQSEFDAHDIDQVGLTLRAEAGEYFIAAVATTNGKPTVAGVQPGDKLLRVGSLDLRTATWGGIYSALHGTPGERRVLTLERGGRELTVAATVTPF